MEANLNSQPRGEHFKQATKMLTNKCYEQSAIFVHINYGCKCHPFIFTKLLKILKFSFFFILFKVPKM